MNNMAEIKLKPCPFCGGEACFKTPMHILNEGIMLIECTACGACPYVVPVDETIGDEANKKAVIAEQWNRRADNEQNY